MLFRSLMKGNEALAHSAIRNGVDGYFGYPITPQSEVMETLMEEHPWDTTGMVVLQAESEIDIFKKKQRRKCIQRNKKKILRDKQKQKKNKTTKQRNKTQNNSLQH